MDAFGLLAFGKSSGAGIIVDRDETAVSGSPTVVVDRRDSTGGEA